MTTFKMQKLVGLPRNLIMAPGAGAPLPLYTLAGFLNREDRKEFVRMLRRRHNVPRRLRDEMALIQYFGSPSVRFFHFWKSKKSFHPYVTGIGAHGSDFRPPQIDPGDLDSGPNGSTVATRPGGVPEHY